MSRSRSGYNTTIEYIGPHPRSPKKKNAFGGWVIVLIALAATFFFGKPLVGSIWASEKQPSESQQEKVIEKLQNEGGTQALLATEALKYASSQVSYDPSYAEIEYPGGDIPQHKGMAADLIVRCYRSLGIDLQKQIHQDMKSDFRVYPQLWNAISPDRNIDHRRVQNLHRFFSRKGEILENSSNPVDYQVGDVVVWAMGNADTHIGIVVPSPEGYEGNATPWVVHHPQGGGVKWEKALFEYQVIGHFRYPAE